MGAGAFGGWTALDLAERGAKVTLVDAWGPGNARASSGGDTRVIRHAYGSDRIYLELAARAMQLWRDAERRWNTELLDRTGVLWMVQDDEAYERAALVELADAGVPHEVLDVDELARRFPQLRLDGVRWAFIEQDAGILYARRSCAAVLDAFVARGGTYRQASAAPGEMRSGRLEGVLLSDGSSLNADAYVFACGPWLGAMFPGLVDGPLVRPTRQELFTFGTPPGAAHEPPALPVWADHGERFWYGIPGNERRGFKIADDTRGADFDPTDGDRTPSAGALDAARRYMEFRFPGMADAPLLEVRVCQYENSPDGDFLVDRHPEAADTWILGGGSGHGFKHGPAMGELVAGCVLGEREPEPRFLLARFAG